MMDALCPLYHTHTYTPGDIVPVVRSASKHRHGGNIPPQLGHFPFVHTSMSMRIQAGCAQPSRSHRTSQLLAQIEPADATWLIILTMQKSIASYVAVCR